MSQETPSKQDRVERHLMRQRGAGSRTVTANFGFSFAITAPNNQPDLIERSAKRRKTIGPEQVEGQPACSNDQNPSVSIEDKHFEGGAANAKRKARRRLPVDTVEDKTNVAQPDVRDDSFVAQARSRARKATRSSAKPQAVEETVPIVVQDIRVSGKGGKVRKRAAAEPMQKVDVDSAGEALLRTAKAPIDDGSGRLKAGDKDNESNQDTEKPDAVADDMVRSPLLLSETTKAGKEHDTSQPRSKAGRAKRQTQQKRRPKETPVDHDVPNESRAGSKTCQRQRPARKRQHAEPEISTSLQEPAPAQQQVKHIKRPQERNKESAQGRVHGQHRNAQTTTQATDTSTELQTSPQVVRQALKEADVNVMRQSISPEKQSQAKAVAAPAKSGRATARRNSSLQMAPPPAAKGRAFSKKAKARVAQDVSAKSEYSSDLIAIENVATQPEQVALEPVAPTTEPCVGQNAESEKQRKLSASTRSKKVSDVSTPRGQTEKPRHEDKEEDIDWLFAPQEPKHAAGQPTKGPTAKHNKNKVHARLDDIDLDDLVSNIASFADVTSKVVFGTRDRRDVKSRKSRVL